MIYWPAISLSILAGMMVREHEVSAWSLCYKYNQEEYVFLGIYIKSWLQVFLLVALDVWAGAENLSCNISEGIKNIVSFFISTSE